MSKKVTTFNIEGRFLGFEFEDHKPKKLIVATSQGEQTIKLAKALRYSFQLRLIPGDWLQISGEQEFDSKGKLKLKAEQVIPSTVSQELAILPVLTDKNKASILVCQKSSCMKRGGKEACQAMQTALKIRGLSEQVSIKGTGCLKDCKAGPNIVMMPDKKRYTKVQASQILALIDKHFGEKELDITEPLVKAH
ncbi:MAG: (2Fe-2S) ferredoxin domain-containing protein [Chroococcus sp. CMT-3BRIN-NPC107]|nr:(2Fe-2S) ferredoxin domain-containing protein [Chroococcus sp. CMT-3BRIN-NPC107]